jgi:hypothetical protein
VYAEASRLVLNGFTLGVEVDIEAKYPNRYVDERGVNMWAIVMGALAKVEGNKLGVHLWTKVRKAFDEFRKHKCDWPCVLKTLSAAEKVTAHD